jgi:hypothetical protein
MTLLALYALCAVYLFALVSHFVRGKREGIGLSLLLFALAIAAGLWAITRSRSSTAGIGIIFLPVLGTVAGLLGLAFAHWRSSPETVPRVAAWLCLGGALAVIVGQLVGGVRSIERNQRHDDEYAAQAKAIVRHRASIEAALARSAGREPEVIDSLVREQMGDRAFLIAALESRHVSPALLDTLASSADLGVALQAVRNPNAAAGTLARIYRTHTYPDYFFQALAAHAHTPPEILREIYERPRTISGLDIWFAGNAATPRDLLERIATKTREASVVQALLQNPALDCALLQQAAASLAASDRPADEYSLARIRELRPTLCR